MTKSVHVIGYDPGITRMFYREGWEIIEHNRTAADAVVFIGGADIDPKLYGEHKGPKMSYTSMGDDLRDTNAWKLTEEGKNGQLKIGICRGAQFLNVMNNGKLIQHVNMHATGEHMVVDALINPGSELLITSVHHQMMIPEEDAEILSYCQGQATEFWGQNGEIDKPALEPETVWYDRTRSLCVQWHPEYPDHKGGPHGCKDYFFKLIDKVI